MSRIQKLFSLLAVLLLAGVGVSLAEMSLEKNFAQPPPSARPWVYWFWNNGNVTKAGITADLEAMQRAGVGGVIIMDVVERFAPPPGTADYMNEEWQELMAFAIREAHRLGLEINLTNGPGWCGSSGPWITPELSMLKLVAANLVVTGPTNFSGRLPQVESDAGKRHDELDSTVKFDTFYRDVAVLAFPKAEKGVVSAAAVRNLTAQMDASGNLKCDLPAGQWVIQRIGCVSTGSSTRPPVKGGNGLECDKLSATAMDCQFTNMLGKIIARAGDLAGQSLTATHIDSWEVGTQNWTPLLREEFQKRRGYDPLPFLPNMTGGDVIGDAETARRFSWDYRMTLAELLAENYVGRLAQLAHEHGLRLTMEGYNLPFGDEAIYTEPVDEPMSEFWTDGGNETEAKARQMASVGHVMGRRIIGAEAFTSGDGEQWRKHPATIKALGDYEFSQGINRFVVHRYAHQPYLDRFPGATMGPWGLHYERTQTWWEMSGAWHEYLSRCQFMLRQGLFVADLCCLRPEQPDQCYFVPGPMIPPGYKYDECSANALIARMNVKDGRLVLPDGMSYRLLVLPDATKMTPALAQKIKQLVAAGATVFGPRPQTSPSLQNFPACDAEVAAIGHEVWGDCDGKAVTEHAFGQGKVIWGRPLAEVLSGLQTPPDFTANVNLNWIHRRDGAAQIYFVANGEARAVEALGQFRVKGLRPERWNPETGVVEPLAVYQATAEGVAVPLHFAPGESAFIVFRDAAKTFDPVIRFTRDGQPVAPPTHTPEIKILSATYGPPGDAARTLDLKTLLQKMVAAGETTFRVDRLARDHDPAFGTVKTFTLEYTLDGQPARVQGRDPDRLSLFTPESAAPRPAKIVCDGNGNLRLAAAQPGRYEAETAGGKTFTADIPAVPAPKEMSGAWTIQFPPKWGAPEKITLERLMSLSDSTNAGVKYFSGTATYTKTFDWQPAAEAQPRTPEYWLDLGNVQVMAQVKLNGHDLGTLWRPPFRVNITDKLQPGANTLEIRVANLWLNRMIGDAALPPEQRFTWSSYEPFKSDTPLPPAGLLGPVQILTRITTPLN